MRRRENLGYLVANHGSQSALADALVSSGLTQPMISTILRRQRPLWTKEAREVEKQLGIPADWLDRHCLRETWKYVRKFRELQPETRILVNEILAFVEGMGGSK